MLNTVVSGLGGVLMESLGHMGWGSRNSLIGVGRSFLDILYLRGYSSMISFWHNVWCGEHPLKVAFPELYKSVYLRVLLWQIIFSSLMALLNRTLILLEQSMIGSWNYFSRFDQLYSIKLKQDGVYKLCWNLSKSGLFDV